MKKSIAVISFAAAFLVCAALSAQAGERDRMGGMKKWNNKKGIGKNMPMNNMGVRANQGRTFRSNNKAEVLQQGTVNQGAIGQRGNFQFGNIDQRGRVNDADLRQQGNFNTGLVNQQGDVNNARLSQQGNANAGVVLQKGKVNNSAVDQAGTNNVAIVGTKGSIANQTQVQQKDGNNIAIVAQDGK